ncbi:MAG: efflux RND transporter periplasmic adaptor subunit [Fimbriimonadia bacterium]|jgi:HlyD family secretion protein
MRIGKRGVVFGCLGLGVIIIGGSTWVAMRAMQPAQKKERTFTVTRGELVVDVVESGTVEAVRAVEVRPRTGGRVASLLVEEGQMVRAGQTLATVDPQETQLVVAQVRAQQRSALSRLQEAGIRYETDQRSTSADLRQAEASYRQARQELETQPKLTEAALDQAKAAMDAASQDLVELQDAIFPQERLNADRAVDDARANLEQRRAEHMRVSNLVAKGYASARELEAAKALFDTAQTAYVSAVKARELLDKQQPVRLKAAEERLKQAQASYRQAQANTYVVQLKKEALQIAEANLAAARARQQNVRATREQVDQARAAVDQVGSQLADAERQLNETEIRSPMNGMATKRYVQVGDLVTALSGFSAGTPVYQIADLSELRVRLQVNEVDVARLREGQDVEITADALQGVKFEGRVHRIAPASEGAAVTAVTADTVVKFEVEVRLRDPDPRLKPGMTAKCRIITGRAKNALLLAAEAVGKETGKDVYYGLLLTGKQVKDKKTGKMVPETRRVPLQIGLKGVTQYEIVSGAKEGDKFAKAPFTGPKRKPMNVFGPPSEEQSEDNQ